MSHRRRECLLCSGCQGADFIVLLHESSQAPATVNKSHGQPERGHNGPPAECHCLHQPRFAFLQISWDRTAFHEW